MDPPALHVLWEELVVLLSDLFGVERTNLFLVIPEKEQLRSRAASQFEWDIELPWNEGIAGRVYQEGQPLSINNIPDSEFGHYFNKDPKGFRTRSMLTVPVHRDGDESEAIVAIIQLVNKIEGDFTSEDLEALKYWSRQIGVTLERSHGMEIWRHPESEPPYLSDPEFDPVLPKRASRQAVEAVPSFVSLAVNQRGCGNLQLCNLAHVENFWEGRELVKMVRDCYRHARVAKQLEGELSHDEVKIAARHRIFLRLIRILTSVTRNRMVAYLTGAYEEWLGFYASAFAYWLYDAVPQNRNALYSLVEDKRSHAVFYESLVLDHLAHHLWRRAEMRIFQRVFRALYVNMTRHMLQRMSEVTHRKELPQQFAAYFAAFTDHRFDALWQRAETRAPGAQSLGRRLLSYALGTLKLTVYSGTACLLFPLAFILPMRELPAREEEMGSLIESTHGAHA